MAPKRRGRGIPHGKKGEHPGQGAFWPARSPSNSKGPKKKPTPTGDPKNSQRNPLPGKKEEPREVIHLVPQTRPREKYTLELTRRINFEHVDAETAMKIMRTVVAKARKKGYTKIECLFEGEMIERVLISLGFRRVYSNTGGWGPEDRRYVYVRTLS